MFKLAPQTSSVAHPASFASEAPTLLLTWNGHPARAELEVFIGAIYAHRFAARVRSYAPMLVGLLKQKTLVAAAGYRDAATEPLYLEHYLNEPIEVLLSRRAGVPVLRERIVEVGHLAAARSGEGLELIRRLAAHLAGKGFEWVACTATKELRPALERLDARPLELGPANGGRLGDEASSWGTYYEHEPVVIAVALKAALRRYVQRRASAMERRP